MLFSMWVSAFYIVGCSVDWFVKKMCQMFLENLPPRTYLARLGK